MYIKLSCLYYASPVLPYVLLRLYKYKILLLVTFTLLLETWIYTHWGIKGSVVVFSFLVCIAYMMADITKVLSDNLYFKLISLKVLWRGAIYIAYEPLNYIILIFVYLIIKSMTPKYLLTHLYLLTEVTPPIKQGKAKKKHSNDLRLQQFRVQTSFQFRHLTYLNIPDSIRVVLYRRVHFIGIALFVILLILGGLFVPNYYNIVDNWLK